MINLFKNIFETAIVFFQNGIFCRKIQRPFLLQCSVETASCKTINAFIGVVHSKCYAISFEVINFMFNHFSIFAFKLNGEFSFPFRHKIGCTVLVAKSMTAYADGGSPVGHQAGNIVHHNRLTKHSAVKYIADGTIGRFPHLFQAKFFHPFLVGCNSGALDAHTILPDGIGCIHSYLIIGFITVFYAQVIIFYVHIKVRKNEFIFNKFPDNTCHFIAI